MHIDYREALCRRCCAWSRSMVDGCAAACMRYAMLLMSPASSSLILNCVVSTASHHINFELSRQRLSSNSIMECVSAAIDVAVMGAPICVENLLSANTRCMLLRVLVLSVPTTSVDSKWAIPVLTTAVALLHIHFRCYYRSRKGCIHRARVCCGSGRRAVTQKKSLIKHVMDNHASCAQALRDAFLVTLRFVTRNALPTWPGMQPTAQKRCLNCSLSLVAARARCSLKNNLEEGERGEPGDWRWEWRLTLALSFHPPK